MPKRPIDEPPQTEEYYREKVLRQCGPHVCPDRKYEREFLQGHNGGPGQPEFPVDTMSTELVPKHVDLSSDELKELLIRLKIKTDGYSFERRQTVYRGLNFHGWILDHGKITVGHIGVHALLLHHVKVPLPLNHDQIAVFISIVTGVGIAPVTDAHALPAILEFVISAGLESVISCVLSFFSLNGWSQPLKSICVLDFLAENFLVYVKYMDQAPVELILALVKNPKLNVPSEEVLLDALVLWGRSHDVGLLFRDLKLEYVKYDLLATHELFRLLQADERLREAKKRVLPQQLGHPDLTRLITDPISMAPYENPVVAPDGYTYSTSVLAMVHIAKPGVSPITGAPMSTDNADAIRNQGMRDLQDIMTPGPPRPAYLDKSVPEFNY
jgi:hypothetical protein